MQNKLSAIPNNSLKEEDLTSIIGGFNKNEYKSGEAAGRIAGAVGGLLPVGKAWKYVKRIIHH